MKAIARLCSAGFASAAAISFIAVSPAYAAEHHTRAVFVQTDNPDGNTIIAYDRGRDGTLSKAGSYPTGGRGGILDGSVVDHLASQGSLAYDRGTLFAVNAGSNTITAFSVHGDRLDRQQVISSGGNFPVSIAVRGNVVYVLNGLDGGSIQGYLRFGDRLVLIPSWHRSLGLDPTATPQFTNTPGQVAFSPDGSRLIVTTKANGSSIDVFRITFGRPSRAVVTSLPGTVPFAVSFDPAGHLIVAEAANSVATFTLRRDDSLRQLDAVATGQQATCWITAIGDHVYASNAGSGTVSGYRVAPDGALHGSGVTATDGGTVDAAATADGRYLYVQAGAAGIVDEFQVGGDGSLTRIGSVTVPGAVGGEGIVAR